MVEANCKARPTDAFEIHLAVQIIHVLDFDYLRMHVEIFMGLFAGRNSHYWVVNFVLLKVLGRPGAQTINNWDISVVVERVFKERWGFGLVAALFLLLSSHLASLDHVGAGGLLMPFKYYPVRLLPDVAVELFVTIESCDIHSADPYYITNLY